ncbi:Tyrosine recombinase XerC [termite gut metagenome]|uniref:Tyrosine recombinase XerC n=2 Tax=termite gut metagenome TaxID=433724 RepID=A0A5J4QTI6_9ZZZZ
MFNYSNNGITVSSILDDRRVTATGYPVKIRVTYKRMRKYYSTGKSLSLEEWGKLPETKSMKLIATRSDIQNTFERIKKVIIELEHGIGFTFDALNLRLGKANTGTINDAFRAKIEDMINAGSVGNAEVYKNSLTRMEHFGGELIAFESITVDWLKRYEKEMLNEGKSYTTISMYIRCIRALFNEAISMGTIRQNIYPFGKKQYEIPIGKGRKMALSLEQIKGIVTYDDGSEATVKHRDLWFFSYLANGININDMLKLKYSNIVNNEICFYRSKTINTTKEKKEICAIITPEMQAIINKWGNKEKSPGNYIFPYLIGNETPIQQKAVIKDIIRRINKRLKKIGNELGISGISTYTARHSFASVLKRSGANIAYISESLGHSDLRTTENYLASFEREEREKNAKLLANFRE